MHGRLVHTYKLTIGSLFRSMEFLTQNSGEMIVNSRRIPNPELSDEEKRKLLKQEKYKPEGIDQVHPFLFLTLDLPPKPLYVDPHKQISIPQVRHKSFYWIYKQFQVHMQSLLEKFNGINEKEYKLKGDERRDPLIKKFRIKKLPEVLIFQISRFAKNNFFVEKNPTIVQYPVKNLDMGPYLSEGKTESIFLFGSCYH